MNINSPENECGGEETNVVVVPEIVVLGLGNVLLRDDGIGVHAVREFLGVCPMDVLAVDVGTAALRAGNLLASPALVIIFDALQAGGVPGSVYATDANGVRTNEVRHSLHDFDLLAMLKSVRSDLPEVLILGAEPEVIDYGLELSASVRAAVPVMIDRALAAIHFWQHAPKGSKPRANSLLQWVMQTPAARQVPAFVVRT